MLEDEVLGVVERLARELGTVPVAVPVRIR
jgi:hypothetical protein